MYWHEVVLRSLVYIRCWLLLVRFSFIHQAFLTHGMPNHDPMYTTPYLHLSSIYPSQPPPSPSGGKSTQFQLNKSCWICELSMNPNIESFMVSPNKSLSMFGIFPVFWQLSRVNVSNSDARGIDFGVEFISNAALPSFSGVETEM